MTTSSPVTDVVILVPGFLAFDKLGEHSYFAETVPKAVSAGLAGTPGRSFLVHAVTAPPVDSLLARQQALLKNIQACLAQHPGARIHLVGHSTGGLDAELLTRVADAAGVAWSEQANVARRQISSIVTIAAPLAGTTLALAPLAAILAQPVLAWPRAIAEARRNGTSGAAGLQLLRVAAAVPRLFWDRAFQNVASAAFTDTSRLLMFLHSIVWRHDLIEDLQPQNVQRLMLVAEDPALPPIRRARVLTIAPETVRSTPEAKLFDAFYTATKEAAARDGRPAFVAELQRRVRSGEVRSIGDVSKLVENIQPGDNDGIVNTLRQLGPGADELRSTVAIVLADHLDVVGYYPNNQVSGKPTPTRLRSNGTRQNGFLESGANFRDPQLLELYDRVAKEIKSATGL